MHKFKELERIIQLGQLKSSSSLALEVQAKPNSWSMPWTSVNTSSVWDTPSCRATKFSISHLVNCHDSFWVRSVKTCHMGRTLSHLRRNWSARRTRRTSIRCSTRSTCKQRRWNQKPTWSQLSTCCNRKSSSLWLTIVICSRMINLVFLC